MHRLTLCVIAKNEESMLGDCLASVRGLADAIIVVDTGSTDRTIEIAREHGALVVEHAWNDDFAAARNAALPHVRGGFVLVLDADERLGPGAKNALRKALRRDDFDCGLLPLHNASELDAEPTDIVAGRARRGDPVSLPRLLRCTSDLRWEGIVHEQVTAWARVHRRIVAVRAPIVHYGAVPSLRDARAKDDRNRHLLERRCELEPDNPTPRAYLARELERKGDSDGALRVADECWQLLVHSADGGRPEHDVVLPATLLAFLSLRAGDHRRALDVLTNARRWSDPHPNLALLAGCAHERAALAADNVIRFAEELAAAKTALLECLAMAGAEFAAEIMPGATSFAGWTRLGTVELLAGDCEDAIRHFEAALHASPECTEARLGLVEAQLDRGAPDIALRELQPCFQVPTPDAWLLGAACAHALGSNDDALTFLDSVRDALLRTPWTSAHRAGRRVELETLLRPSLLPTTHARCADVRSVTVVIPAYNRLDLLRPVLEGFAAQSEPDGFEVLVVDDGSSPPVADLMRALELPREFRALRREHNGGRGAALNSGVRAAHGDVVIFCDSDIVPTPEFVAEHRAFHRLANDRGATCLGALDWGVDAGLFGSWTGARSNPRLRGGSRKVDWTQWFTDNWSFRRSLFADHQLAFDEAYRAWGFEELDLALELVRVGATNTLVEAARGFHLKAASPESLQLNFARSVPNLLRLAGKHPDEPVVRAWLRPREASASTVERCRALFEYLWHASGQIEERDALVRASTDPRVDRIAKSMSDFVFRVGIARGFVELGSNSPSPSRNDELDFLTSCAESVVDLAHFELTQGRAGAARVLIEGARRVLALDTAEALAWDERVAWFLRRKDVLEPMLIP